MAVLFSEEKAGHFTLGFITLDNPRSLNALDLKMLRAMGERLLEWRERADIACVVVNAGSEKAFCAGGDIKSLVVGLQREETSVAQIGSSKAPRSNHGTGRQGRHRRD